MCVCVVALHVTSWGLWRPRGPLLPTKEVVGAASASSSATLVREHRPSCPVHLSWGLSPGVHPRALGQPAGCSLVVRRQWLMLCQK